MRNGVLLNLGSPDQLKCMSVSELETLIGEKMKCDSRFGIEYAKDTVSSAFGNYKRTFDKIVSEHQNKPDEGDK